MSEKIKSAETPKPEKPIELQTTLVLPDDLPVIASGSTVLYPQQLVPIVATEERDVKAIDEAASSEEKMLAVLPQKMADGGKYEGDLRGVGATATIVRMAKAPDGSIHAILQGLGRVKLVELADDKPWLRAKVEAVVETGESDAKAEAMSRDVLRTFGEVVDMSDSMPSDLKSAAEGMSDTSTLSDFVAGNLQLKPEERYKVLVELDVNKRLSMVRDLLAHEVDVSKVQSKIQSEVQGELDKRQREFILREQMKEIQRELGEGEITPELTELKERLGEAKLSEAAQKEADRELQRLSTIPSMSPEYQVARTYLEWLADLPWSTSTDDELDIKRAEKILDEDHFGLDKVKRRILDFLAVLKLKQGDTRGPILCFVGPPGTGKTSLGQSVARALGRNFIRVALGGIRDEAEIRGHRRTYVGALPGRIIREIKRSGSNNQVLMLDEVDKIGSDYRGDPASALLEVLDPAQNSTFTDHYLDVAFDLSKVFFIATANVQDTIPAPLRDRMEIIELSGYTEHEKLEIAKRYLLPRQLEENGIPTGGLKVTDGAIREVIRSYTREAGVRNLERELGSICRGVARGVASGDTSKVTITGKRVSVHLGSIKFRWEMASEKDEVGVATGLAATAAGGDVLFVEVSVTPGKGRLTLTGQLGDVMQESAQAALTYSRTRASALGVPDDFLDTHDVHIHVPAGAVPKDGPSAGVTLSTALASAMTGRPVRKDVAMTGEITLHGKVLPVGAIRDKTLAAHRAGCKVIVMPRDNENDIEDVPDDVRRDLRIVFVDHVDDVLNEALHARKISDRPKLASVGT